MAVFRNLFQANVALEKFIYSASREPGTSFAILTQPPGNLAFGYDFTKPFVGYPFLFAYTFAPAGQEFSGSLCQRCKHAWNTYFMGSNAGKSTKLESETGQRKVECKHTVRFGGVIVGVLFC